jgi:hypothetical protein
MVPPLTDLDGSWVIVDKQSGQAVLELFRDSVAIHHLNFAKYTAIPILTYLGDVNRRIMLGEYPAATLAKG